MRIKKPQEWIEEIDAALEYRRQFGREDAWDKIERNYTHDPTGDTALGPNLVYAMGDALTSALIVPDPEFIVTPERMSAIEKAPIVEALDNFLVRRLRIKQYIDISLLHAYLCGVAILKIGYDSEFGWAPYYDIGQGNTPLGMTLTQFDKKGRRIESPDTQPGWPWLRPVHPRDFVVPWGTIFLEDAIWCAHRIVRHIDKIKADPKYINTSRLQPTISMEDFVRSYSVVGAKSVPVTGSSRQRSAYSKKPEFVEMWEIRDRETGRVIVVSRDYDEFLRNADDAIQYAVGMPFVSATFNRHPRSFWSTPPAYYLGQIQATQYDIALQAEKLRRISVLKFLYRKNAISQEALTRLLSSDVGAAEGIDSQFPLNEIIQPIQTGPQYDSVYYSEQARRDAREAIGFSRNQLGEFDQSSRRTAREATFVEAGSQRRSGKRESAVVDLYINAMRAINNTVFSFWRVPRDILTDIGWQVVTGDMLAGDYLYDLTLTSKRNLSKLERKLEAMQLFSSLANIPNVDIRALAQMLVSASSDPHFGAALFSLLPTGASGPQAAGLPTLPATGESPATPAGGNAVVENVKGVENAAV